MSRNNFSWQKDTGYITFYKNKDIDANETNPNKYFYDSRFVFLLHRENRVAVYSMDEKSLYRNISVLNPHINSLDVNLKFDEIKAHFQSWINYYGHDILKRIKKFKLSYYCMFSPDKTVPMRISVLENYFNSKIFFFRPSWRNSYPELKVFSDFVKDLDPELSHTPVEFYWLTKKNLLWYLKNWIVFIINLFNFYALSKVLNYFKNN